MDYYEILNVPRDADCLTIKNAYKKLSKLYHPDCSTGDRAKFEQVQEAWRILGDDKLRVIYDKYGATQSLDIIVKSKKSKSEYKLQVKLATGDSSDIYLAVSNDKQYIFKISRSSIPQELLQHEFDVLSDLVNKSKSLSYMKYLPQPIESFTINDKKIKRANVFEYVPDFYTLEKVREKKPDGLDGRHIGWIFKRLLTILGYAHQLGIIHNAVLPSHVLINPKNHALQLVGWIHSINNGQITKNISTKYKLWYPHEVLNKKPVSAMTDIYLAAKCCVFLVGGDPVIGSMPRFVPLRMQNFLKSCLMVSPNMRPSDAWDLLHEFDETLQSLYGPPKFCELVL